MNRTSLEEEPPLNINAEPKQIGLRDIDRNLVSKSVNVPPASLLNLPGKKDATQNVKVGTPELS